MKSLFQNICRGDEAQQPGSRTVGGGGRASFPSAEGKQFTSCSRCLLLKPGVSGWPRSAKPPEWARVRAPARLGPRGPSRAGSAPTHIPGRQGPGLFLCRGSPPPDVRRKPGPGGQRCQGGRGGGANSRKSRAPAQPVSAAEGR